eukprot:gene10309-7207_t
MEGKTILRSGRNKEVKVFVPPADLTVRQIEKQIAPHHFKRSLVKGSLYVLRDIAQVALTYYVMYNYVVPALDSVSTSAMIPVPLMYAIKFVVWNIFWFVQGLNGTGLWVMAHECGHQAFSDSRTINDSVGLVLHSALLVPYHSWRISHGTHHKHTNHLTKDTVFIPKMQPTVVDLVEETPVVALVRMLRMFLFGWPAYLLFNASNHDYGRRTNHFEPSSPLFQPEDAMDIVISDLGILAALSCLGMSIYRFGLLNVMCWYVYPYLWVNFWLLYVTFLQHTDLRIPHYDQENWTFARGGIAAVDRDFGPLLNSWMHHIQDSHVIHHLFSQMPFYEAIKVTRKYCRPIFGDLYVTDNSSLWKSLWTTWRECIYVVPTDGVAVFRGPTRKAPKRNEKGGNNKQMQKKFLIEMNRWCGRREGPSHPHQEASTCICIPLDLEIYRTIHLLNPHTAAAEESCARTHSCAPSYILMRYKPPKEQQAEGNISFSVGIRTSINPSIPPTERGVTEAIHLNIFDC